MQAVDGRPEPRPFFYALASAKFVAALVIMTRHYAFFLPKEYATLSDFLARLNFVEFFFAASGFALVMSYKDRATPAPAAFLIKSVAKFYPLHLLTTMFYAILAFAASSGLVHGFNDRNQIADLPAILSLTNAWGTLDHFSFNYPSWYLSALLAAYIAFFPAMSLLKAGRQSILAGLTVLIIVVLEAAPGLFHWTEWTYRFGAVRALPTFFLGMLVAWNFHVVRKAIRARTVIAVLYLFTVLGMGMDVAPTISFCLLQVALVAALASVEANGTRVPVLGSDRFQPFQALLLPLFLLHIPVATVFLSFAFKSHLDGPSAFLFIAITMAISVTGAAAYLPASRALSRQLKRMSPPSRFRRASLFDAPQANRAGSTASQL